MRRITIGSFIAAAALLAPMGMNAATAATPATATYSTVSDWGSGFEGKVTVKAGTSALTSWKVEFDLPSGTTISRAWDADVTSSGNHYTSVKKSWTGGLAPGATVSWGFNGAPGGLTGALNCKINGGACTAAAPRRPPPRRPRPRRPPTPPTPTPPTTPPPTTTRRPRAARRSSATSPSGASTAATTT